MTCGRPAGLPEKPTRCHNQAMSHGSLPPPLPPPFEPTAPVAQVAPTPPWAVPAPPPAALPPARFGLRWYAFAMVGVWVAVEIWKTWPVALVRATAPDMAPTYFLGHCVGALLIVLGLTYLVWRITRCSRTISTLVFCCVLTTCVLSVLLP